MPAVAAVGSSMDTPALATRRKASTPNTMPATAKGSASALAGRVRVEAK